MTDPLSSDVGGSVDRNWGYYSPVHVTFGIDSLVGLPALLKRPSSLLLVSTRGAERRGHVDRVRDLLQGHELSSLDSVLENPDVQSLGRQAASLNGVPDIIVAIGGGSTIDTAKVLSFTLRSNLDGQSLTQALDEGVSPAREACIPMIAIPTTAGSGSEVTPFATVWNRQTRRKHSLMGPGLFPHAAVVDPRLTSTVPGPVTVSTGLDALSQGLEAFWNRQASPITDALATRAVRLVLDHLARLSRAPDDLRLRSILMEASLLAGLAIAQTRTGLAHSISYPLTAHHGLAHGVACAFTLPTILEYNALERPERFNQLAQQLGEASVTALSARISKLLEDLAVGATLAQHEIGPGELEALQDELISPGRAGNNLRYAGPDTALFLAKEALSRLNR